VSGSTELFIVELMRCSSASPWLLLLLPLAVGVSENAGCRKPSFREDLSSRQLGEYGQRKHLARGVRQLGRVSAGSAGAWSYLGRQVSKAVEDKSLDLVALAKWDEAHTHAP
jgi:hypothetical protein